MAPLSSKVGTRISSGLEKFQAVLRDAHKRVEPTLALTVSTLLVAVCLAIPLGVIAAWKVRTWVDRAAMVFVVMGFSMPAFLVGYVLIYIFAVKLKWLPTAGMARPRCAAGSSGSAAIASRKVAMARS